MSRSSSLFESSMSAHNLAARPLVVAQPERYNKTRSESDSAPDSPRYKYDMTAIVPQADENNINQQHL